MHLRGHVLTSLCGGAAAAAKHAPVSRSYDGDAACVMLNDAHAAARSVVSR